jgi:hypothetical protein
MPCSKKLTVSTLQSKHREIRSRVRLNKTTNSSISDGDTVHESYRA